VEQKSINSETKIMKTTFCIFTQSERFDLCMQGDGDITDSIHELLDVFCIEKDGRSIFNPIQCVTENLIFKVGLYVDRYKEKSPQLNKLNKVISDLPKGSKFFVLSDFPTDTKAILELEVLLTAVNKYDNEDEIINYVNSQFAVFDEALNHTINNYKLFIPKNYKRVVIGEKVKEKRVCRFCNGTLVSGAKFKKIAHAIPEALGNKNIILAEECDACNKFFGDNIEPSLIEYLNYHRVTLGLKGKDGYPKIKYKNGTVFFDGNKSVVMSKDITRDENGSIKVKLISKNKFIPVNFYKALCKMTISVMAKSQLKHIKRTIDWLKSNDKSNEQLPMIGMQVDNIGFTTAPQIAVLIRTNDSINMPHVVSEFRLGSYVFVYILPFSDNDKLKYSNEEEFKIFCEAFPQFSSDKGWRYRSFDSYEPKELVNNICVNENKSGDESHQLKCDNF